MEYLDGLDIIVIMPSLALCGMIVWVYRLLMTLKKYQNHELIWLKRLDAAREMSLINDITAEQTLELIEKTSTLQAWWHSTSDDVLTDHHVQDAPFWIDPHIGSMALRTQKPIHQHQMAHSDWAFAYIPKVEDGKLKGLFAIASAPNTTAIDQRLDEKWVEFLCAHWR